jgi:hypothetical protein
MAALALLAGTWQGQLLHADGTVDRFTFLHDPPLAGPELGFLTMAIPGSTPAPVTLLDANQRAFVVLAGPYFDPRLGKNVLTVFEGLRSGIKLAGQFYTRAADGGDCSVVGLFTARRVAAMHQAA